MVGYGLIGIVLDCIYVVIFFMWIMLYWNVKLLFLGFFLNFKKFEYFYLFVL